MTPDVLRLQHEREKKMVHYAEIKSQHVVSFVPRIIEEFCFLTVQQFITVSKERTF